MGISHLADAGQKDALYGRLHNLEKLLKNVRAWFSPYTSTEKWCMFCGAQMADPHLDACPYPKWSEEVTYLLGPQ
jgi:hypothetical protein